LAAVATPVKDVGITLGPEGGGVHGVKKLGAGIHSLSSSPTMARM
jgi:hypothetical protein